MGPMGMRMEAMLHPDPLRVLGSPLRRDPHWQGKRGTA